MESKRGCINPECECFHKHTKFEKKDNFCTKCGSELHYVCSKCFKPVENQFIKYCDSCLEEIEFKKKKREELIDKGKKAVVSLRDSSMQAVQYVIDNADTVKNGYDFVEKNFLNKKGINQSSKRKR